MNAAKIKQNTEKHGLRITEHGDELTIDEGMYITIPQEFAIYKLVGNIAVPLLASSERFTNKIEKGAMV